MAEMTLYFLAQSLLSGGERRVILRPGGSGDICGSNSSIAHKLWSCLKCHLQVHINYSLRTWGSLRSVGSLLENCIFIANIVEVSLRLCLIGNFCERGSFINLVSLVVAGMDG